MILKYVILSHETKLLNSWDIPYCDEYLKTPVDGCLGGYFCLTDGQTLSCRGSVLIVMAGLQIYKKYENLGEWHISSKKLSNCFGLNHGMSGHGQSI